jgi:uncharacterized membrane protein YkvA (DUF1232 family)
MRTDEVTHELKKWGASIPDLGKLLVALLLDARVPRANKLVVGAIAAYLVTPAGLAGKRILGLKRVQELILPVIALDVLINGADDEVLKEHWDGDPEVLRTLQGLARRGSSLAPMKLRRLLGTAG